MKTIPSNITNENILNGINYLAKNGIREQYQSRDYDIYYKKRRYPPKDVLRIANKYQNGVELSDFKGGQRNANKFLKARGFLVIKKNQLVTTEFFTVEELRRFKRIAGKPYNKLSADNKIELNYLFSTLFNKTNYWAESIVPSNFIIKRDKAPLLNDYRQMIFKPYTWAKICRKRDDGRHIFFTVGVDAKDMTLVYKIDCQWNNKKKYLDNIQIEKFRDRIKNSPAKRQEIQLNQLKSYNWDKLINVTNTFILNYINLYDDIVNYVWNDRIDINKKYDGLVLRDPPISSKKKNKKMKRRKGTSINWEGRYKENKELGDFGESKVKQYEIDSLIAAGKKQLINKVKKVKDGLGYDIRSVNKLGNVKYIEVKTTTKSKNSSFPISANEYDFLLSKKNDGFIYRLYNADKKLGFAEFYIIDWEMLTKDFIADPHSYVLKRK